MTDQLGLLKVGGDRWDGAVGCWNNVVARSHEHYLALPYSGRNSGIVGMVGARTQLSMYLGMVLEFHLLAADSSLQGASRLPVAGMHPVERSMGE